MCKKDMSPKEILDDYIKVSFLQHGEEMGCWNRRGREGECEWSGCPKAATTDKNIELVHSQIMCDRRRSLHDIARQIGIRFGAV